MKTSDIVKSMTALLCLGKSHFEATEPFRADRFLLGSRSSAWVKSEIEQWVQARINARKTQ